MSNVVQINMALTNRNAKNAHFLLLDQRREWVKRVEENKRALDTALSNLDASKEEVRRCQESVEGAQAWVDACDYGMKVIAEDKP